MKRTDKKGFTIVELVIVIAVIAILAAVLIPNISKLVQKANTSADESLVRNLNTALSMDVEKHTTMSEALKAAKDNGGYDLETIELKGKGNKILWDSVNDCFVYLKGTDRVYLPNTQSVKKASEMKDYEYFEIVKEVPAAAEQKYSIYLAGDTNTDAVEVSVGFDAGANKISKVTLKTDETRKVLIYTNGGELVVNAKNATVEHRGDAMSVTITAVAPNSYHEFGTITGNIEIANGRVVMETGSKAAAIKVTATAADITGGKATISIDNTASEVAVVVPAEVKTAIENKGGENNTINAKADSVITDATAIENMSKFAGGLGTEESPYLIASNEDFANIISGLSTKTIYYKLISDIEVANNYDSNDDNYECAAYSLKNSVFYGENHTITANVHLFYQVYRASIVNLKVKLTSEMVCYATYATFENVDTVGEINRGGPNHGIYVLYAAPDFIDNEITYIDCDCAVNFTGEGNMYNAVFTGYAYPGGYKTTLNYTNCTYSGIFVSGKAAMFLGNNSANQGVVTINLSNCTNYGIIQATMTGSNYYWNSYVATGIKPDETDKSFIKNTVILNGVKLTANNVTEPMSAGFMQGPNDANLNLVQNADGSFTLTASENPNAAYYVITVGLYSDYLAGGTLIQNVSEKFLPSNFENGTLVTNLKKLSFVDKAWVEANSGATPKVFGEGEYSYTVYTLNGVEYYYLPDTTNATLNGDPKAPQMIYVSCYSTDGKLIASVTLKTK